MSLVYNSLLLIVRKTKGGWVLFRFYPPFLGVLDPVSRIQFLNYHQLKISLTFTRPFSSSLASSPKALSQNFSTQLTDQHGASMSPSDPSNRSLESTRKNPNRKKVHRFHRMSVYYVQFASIKKNTHFKCTNINV